MPFDAGGGGMLFTFEQAMWRLVGLWPGAARRRLWLPVSLKIGKANAQIKLAISTIVRNEASDLDEWLEFHCMMGVEHFYIYNNGSTDGTAEKLRQSPYADRITVIDWANFLSGWEGWQDHLAGCSVWPCCTRLPTMVA